VTATTSDVITQEDGDDLPLVADVEQREAGWSWDVRANRIAWALVAAGVVLRLIRYFANRSLWLDEAYLSESILTYDFGRFLTNPLMHWQAAPVGFLLLEKLGVLALGTSEFGLRLVPLLSGLASVFLFARVVKRCLPPAGGLGALAMFVTLEPLVYYSAEVKQYEMDVAVALAVLLSAMLYSERSGSIGRVITLGLVGAAGLFCSHPAVFVIAGCGLVLLIEFLRRRETGAALLVAVVSAVWAILFGLNYVLFLRPLVHHEGLAAYWQSGFMPLDRTAVLWLGRSLHGIYADYSTMWMPLPDVAVVAAALGLAWMSQRDRRTLGFVVMPAVLALAAAMLQRFPFSGRLILFVVPFAVLALGAAMQAVLDATLPGRRLIPAFVLAVLFAPTIGRGLFFAAFPPGREEIKPLVAYVGEHARPGDGLYVLNLPQVPYRYYRDRFGIGPDRFNLTRVPWIAGNQIEPTEAAFTAELAQLKAKGRVWVLLSHIGAMSGPDEGKIVPKVLDAMGTRLEFHEARGAKLFLYDFTPPTSSAPARTTAPGSPPR
jgi:hypothetical protein